eukprot:1907258-Rhodomonas_salina.1
MGVGVCVCTLNTQTAPTFRLVRCAQGNTVCTRRSSDPCLSCTLCVFLSNRRRRAERREQSAARGRATTGCVFQCCTHARNTRAVVCIKPARACACLLRGTSRAETVQVVGMPMLDLRAKHSQYYE